MNESGPDGEEPASRLLHHAAARCLKCKIDPRDPPPRRRRRSPPDDLLLPVSMLAESGRGFLCCSWSQVTLWTVKKGGVASPEGTSVFDDVAVLRSGTPLRLWSPVTPQEEPGGRNINPVTAPPTVTHSTGSGKWVGGPAPPGVP